MQRANKSHANSRALAYVLLAVAVAIVVVPFWPGMLWFDSAVIVQQARNGVTTDWWTPWGSLALRGWLGLGLGLEPLYIAAVSANVAGTYLCGRIVFSRVLAATLGVAVTAFPPVYGQLAGLSRDSFHSGFALIAMGAVGHAKLRDQPAHSRRAFTVIAVVASIAAFVCRQNGIAIMFAVLTVLLARDLQGFRPVIRAVAMASLMCVLLLVATTVAKSTAGIRQVHPERSTMVYDLAAIDQFNGWVDFARILRRAQEPGAFTNAMDGPWAAARFRWEDVYSMYREGVNPDDVTDYADEEIATRENRVLRDAWWSAVTAHPVDYVRARLRLMSAQLGFVRRPDDAFLPRHVVENGDDLRFPALYRISERYTLSFVSRISRVPLDLPWMYVVAVLMFAVLLTRVRAQTASVAQAAALVIVANALVVSLLVPVTAFRFLSPAPVLALLLGAFWIQVARRSPPRQ